MPFEIKQFPKRFSIDIHKESVFQCWNRQKIWCALQIAKLVYLICSIKNVIFSRLFISISAGTHVGVLDSSISISIKVDPIHTHNPNISQPPPPSSRKKTHTLDLLRHDIFSRCHKQFLLKEKQIYLRQNIH